VALTPAGHKIDSTGNPEEALSMIGKKDYDVVFLDIRMPGMSGTELYGRILQKIPALARRVIFMTGDASDAGIRAFLTRNNLPFLTKPFEGKALEDKVRSCLEAD
jgi:CheY-like chemotaxis protein